MFIEITLVNINILTIQESLKMYKSFSSGVCLNTQHVHNFVADYSFLCNLGYFETKSKLNIK